MSRVREFSLVPNMRFASPELTTATPQISAQADIFSIGCLIYYLALLSKDNASKAYLLNQSDTTSKQLHENEVGSLPRRIDAALNGLDLNL